jgi:putative membrane protein
MEEEANQSLRQNDPEQIIDPRTKLSVEGTELALERTQLAWIRTTLTFLASGIGLDKGIEAMHKARIETGDALFENAHVIGITLSITGTVLMVITTWYYIHRSKRLARMRGTKPLRFPPGAIASVLIIILGIGISFLQLVS